MEQTNSMNKKNNGHTGEKDGQRKCQSLLATEMVQFLNTPGPMLVYT